MVQKEVVRQELEELKCIEDDVKYMREKLLEKRPSHFSKRDIINAFVGSLILGLTFILKGGLIKTAVKLTTMHIELIIASTLGMLMVEIYFISYSRVKNKSERKLGQFMTKRLFTLYSITLIVSFYLIYILNLNNSEYIATFADVLKVAVVVAMPCAIGAAIPSLLKQY